MVTDRERIEVERVVNLVQGFGWSKEKEEISDQEIKITLTKARREPEAPATPT